MYELDKDWLKKAQFIPKYKKLCVQGPCKALVGPLVDTLANRLEKCEHKLVVPAHVFYCVLQLRPIPPERPFRGGVHFKYKFAVGAL
jgi:hypothetical protein